MSSAVRGSASARKLAKRGCYVYCLFGQRLALGVARYSPQSTSIFLFNPRAYAASANVSFRDDNGLPLQIPFAKDGVPIFSATIDIALPPFGSAEIVTSGLSPTVTQGYAVVLRKIGSMLALASFRQRIPGRPDFEATLPAELPTAAINACPFDNTNGFSTGIALLNPDSIPAQYVLSFYDSNGISVTEQLITLRSLQKSAFDSDSHRQNHSLVLRTSE